MLVGMASVAAAVIGSPLTMVFLVLEGTDNFPVTVGVMAGVVVASTIVRLAFGYSFSTWRFHQRGIGIRGAHDIGWLADLTVSRLMRADAKMVPETTPLAELREKFPPGSHQARVRGLRDRRVHRIARRRGAARGEAARRRGRTARNSPRKATSICWRTRTYARRSPVSRTRRSEPAGPRIAD